MRGPEGRSCCAEARQHFLMSVVRLKTIFWEIERRKTQPLVITQPETGATFNIRHLSSAYNGRSLTGAYAPFCVP
ncbi:hypothetical protein TNIN_16861 [Trichonephila inaurata madagascariensis]|uniref:Uncharacterized protein n=1 Tax=Trichonephila inaurata madagascariensis TaxID=2747483 RepID=A0A8X7CCC9_9ARAC|nr:hypothetical protein TNIN_16861 [Trichonephila inaurata madagascariensis]